MDTNTRAVLTILYPEKKKNGFYTHANEKYGRIVNVFKDDIVSFEFGKYHAESDSVVVEVRTKDFNMITFRTTSGIVDDVATKIRRSTTDDMFISVTI